MTTEKQSDQATATTVNDNKEVFGPLGTYAVVAVIMVSIIVTSAIMLDKQLNVVEGQIAAIESDMTEVQTIDSNNIYTVVNHEPATIIASTPETKVVQEAVVTAEVEAAPAAEQIAETPSAEVEAAPAAEQIAETPSVEVEAAPAAEQIAETPSAEVLVAIEETAVTAQKTEQVTAVESVEATIPVESRQAQIAKENQDRTESYKLEQKQRMAEMFARIRSLESQQLDQYKSSQDEQIARLRNQVTSQQEMIDSLILRNKEHYELRAANVKKNQTNREQALNRI